MFSCVYGLGFQLLLCERAAEDVLKLLERCKPGLRPGGFIFIKENICREGFIADHEDNSLTRSNAYMLELIDKAGLSLRYNIKQKNFPKGLYEVRMYVLQP